MKFLIAAIIIIFMVGLPLSTLNHNYDVFKTYRTGLNCKSVVERKSENGYSSRTNYYVYVKQNDKEIQIKVPYSICNKTIPGDIIEYKYLEGNSFGVYAAGLYPFNFFMNLLVLILGLFFLYYLFSKKSFNR